MGVSLRLGSNAAVKRAGVTVAEIKVHGRRKQLDAKAREVGPFLEECQAAEFMTIQEQADALNSHGYTNTKGGSWSFTNTRDVLKRAIEFGYSLRITSAAHSKETSHTKREKNRAAIQSKLISQSP